MLALQLKGSEWRKLDFGLSTGLVGSTFYVFRTYATGTL